VVVIASTLASAPQIWYQDSNGALSLAGKSGIKNGIGFVKGGVLLNETVSGSIHTYTLGLLTNHMSKYLVAVKPTIESISPTNIAVGQTLTVNGYGFDTNAVVKVGGVVASRLSWRDDVLTVTVPSINTGTYNVKVVNSDGQISNTYSLSVAGSNSLSGATADEQAEPESNKGAKQEDSSVTAMNFLKKIDFNNDEVIDIYDFNSMMASWGSSNKKQASDLNGDGKVDLSDYNLLMAYWPK